MWSPSRQYSSRSNSSRYGKSPTSHGWPSLAANTGICSTSPHRYLNSSFLDEFNSTKWTLLYLCVVVLYALVTALLSILHYSTIQLLGIVTNSRRLRHFHFCFQLNHIRFPFSLGFPFTFLCCVCYHLSPPPLSLSIFSNTGLSFCSSSKSISSASPCSHSHTCHSNFAWNRSNRFSASTSDCHCTRC